MSVVHEIVVDLDVTLVLVTLEITGGLFDAADVITVVGG